MGKVKIAGFVFDELCNPHHNGNNQKIYGFYTKLELESGEYALVQSQGMLVPAKFVEYLSIDEIKKPVFKWAVSKIDMSIQIELSEKVKRKQQLQKEIGSIVSLIGGRVSKTQLLSLLIPELKEKIMEHDQLMVSIDDQGIYRYFETDDYKQELINMIKDETLRQTIN